MKEVNIRQARRIAKECDASGVIVLTFDGDDFSAASYGTTAKACKSYRITLDQIAKWISDGVLYVPILDRS